MSDAQQTSSAANELPAVARPWVALADRYGLPLLLLGLVALVFWRAASWFEPRASRLFDEHVETVRELRANSAKQTDILGSLGNQTDETGRLVQEIHGAVLKRSDNSVRGSTGEDSR